MNYEKALAAAQAQLQPGERKLVWQKANYRGGKKNSLLSGAILVTDRRVIFIGSQMLEQASFSIPLNTITSVDNHRQLVQAYTRITSASAVHEFIALADNLIGILNQARSGGLAAAPAPAAPPADVATQLHRLAELHASGALTADEFAAAKSRLLA